MDNTSSIFSRQNQDISIRMLAAAKQTYLDAKTFFKWQIILVVVVTILISVLKAVALLLFKIDISGPAAAYGLIVTVIDIVFFNPKISFFRTSGAKIQELFDCTVYPLEWNSVCAGKKPEIEIVNKQYGRFLERNVLDKLYDWYPIELSRYSSNEAILKCQRTNLAYDGSLRNQFRNLAGIIAAVVIIILIVISLLGHATLERFFLNCLMLLPIISFALKVIIDQNKAITAASDLKNQLQTIESNNGYNDIGLRQIQDKIYQNRKDSTLIPEWYYDKNRDRLEKQMHDDAKLI